MHTSVVSECSSQRLSEWEKKELWLDGILTSNESECAVKEEGVRSSDLNEWHRGDLFWHLFHVPKIVALLRCLLKLRCLLSWLVWLSLVKSYKPINLGKRFSQSDKIVYPVIHIVVWSYGSGTSGAENIVSLNTALRWVHLWRVLLCSFHAPYQQSLYFQQQITKCLQEVTLVSRFSWNSHFFFS